MKNNSQILITGGTGSFGKMFVPLTLKKFNPKRLVIFSRDEMKQWEMQKEYKNDSRVREEGLHHGASYIEHLELIDCIRQGKSAIVDCQNGLDSMVLGLAAQASIDTGEPIYLNEFLRNKYDI